MRNHVYIKGHSYFISMLRMLNQIVYIERSLTFPSLAHTNEFKLKFSRNCVPFQNCQWRLMHIDCLVTLRIVSLPRNVWLYPKRLVNKLSERMSAWNRQKQNSSHRTSPNLESISNELSYSRAQPTVRPSTWKPMNSSIKETRSRANDRTRDRFRVLEL